MRALRTVALAGAAAVALSGIAIGAASADPTFTPTTSDIAAVGSDTTQALFNQWSQDYVPTTGGRLASFDAVPPAGATNSISTKNDPACATTRPNGSGAGITELTKNTPITGGTTAAGPYCVDIARSSRQITAADGNVSSVALAGDLISWSSETGSPAPASLTEAQLTDIYECNADARTWNQVGGTSTDPIVPVLPQASSGTRQTFLLQLGGNITAITPGACVINGDGSLPIEENEGTNSIFTTGTIPSPGTGTVTPSDIIYPFSVGSYIAQADLGTNTPDSHGTLQLGQVDDVAPVLDPGTTTATPNSDNFSVTFHRVLFAVVRGTSVPSNLQPLLGNGDGTGWVCTNATAQQDIAQQGFSNLGALCGTLTNF